MRQAIVVDQLLHIDVSVLLQPKLRSYKKRQDSNLGPCREAQSGQTQELS